MEEYVPSLHFVQVNMALAAEAVEYDPTAQSTHVYTPFVGAIIVEYFPAGQPVQLVAAISEVYVPAAHPMQTVEP